MKASNILILGGIAAGLIWFLGRKTLATAVRFSIEEVKLIQGKIQLTLGVLNPTKQKATLSAIVADFFFQGKQVATVEYYNKVTIMPLAKTKITVTITPKAVGVLSTVLNFLVGTSAEKIKAKLVGTGTVDNVALPINVDYAA
jgi:hypothetical protein